MWTKFGYYITFSHIIKMNTLLNIAVLSAFISLQFVYSKSIANTGPSFEIKDGNCSNAGLDDLVFKDHLHKYPIPFIKRDDKSHYAGDKKIYCVVALSQQEESEGSTVEITEGGANHTFVTLKLQSKKSHGFEYNIQVFAK
ncbi:unnamed protein product [Psylliodes chrysocephalus]|uniref:Uncharacterized protein n=1 Tax=Psylliodes chrysocephalus TaxID=3402493 RepID=A0A9P0G7Y8_9CUCU|nr:unnamed protein product [Psylliodes chrysocephala]